MKCEDALDLISAVLDGEATPAEAAALEEHLNTCPPCRELAAELGVLSAELRTEDPLPEGLPARLEAALDGADAAARAKKQPLWRRWGGLAAVLALALCLGGVYHLAGQGGQPLVEPQVPDCSTGGGAQGRSGGDDGAAVAAYAEDGEALTVDDPTRDGPLANAGEYAASPVEPPVGAHPEPGHYHFTNARYIRVDPNTTPAAPSAVILGSVAELTEYLAVFDSLVWDGEGNTVPIAELEELKADYGDAFFQNGRLLAVVVEEGSGSIRHELDPQGLLRDQVTVRRIVPEVGTADMAAWLIVAEVDAMFDGGDTLAVNVEEVPAGTADQRSGAAAEK